MTRTIAIALLHHPVLDRAGQVVTTSMTNMDLHDMARSAKSYGLASMFVVHPIEAQRELVRRIREHWVAGSGKNRIPDRALALELIRCVVTLDEVLAELGPDTEIWTTAAEARGADVVRYADAKTRLAAGTSPVLLVFGTGWGLAPSVIDQAALRLEPIAAGVPTGYNHLSVRAACAITLDRLLG